MAPRGEAPRALKNQVPPPLPTTAGNASVEFARAEADCLPFRRNRGRAPNLMGERHGPSLRGVGSHLKFKWAGGEYYCALFG